MNRRKRAASALVSIALGVFAACARPRPEPRASPDAPPSDAALAVEPDADRAAAAAPTEPGAAAGPAGPETANVAAGASVDVWAVAGPLDRGYEPLGGEPPSWSTVWTESGRAPTPPAEHAGDADYPGDEALASSWIARVRGALRVTEAGPRELELTLSGGARVALDGKVVLDRFAEDTRGTTRIVLGELAAGEHSFELWTWGNAGARELSLAWRRDEAHPWRWLARNDWSHATSTNRAVPGLRRVLRPNERRPGVELSPALAPAFVVESYAMPGLEQKAVGLASLASERWLVLEGGARAKVRLHELAGGALTPARTFASGFDHPGGIAVSDGRVFVAQKNELTELVDRDSDGVADEYKVALELPGREFARPVGLAVDQGLAAILFDSDRGLDAVIASLADGRTTIHHVGGRGEAHVAAGFDGAFFVVSHCSEPPSRRGAWLGLVAERAWSLDLGDGSQRLGVIRPDVAPIALVERGPTFARFAQGASTITVALTTDGYDVSTAVERPGSPIDDAHAVASSVEGVVACLGANDPTLTLVRRARGVATLLAATSRANAIELEFASPLALDTGWETDAWAVMTDGLRPPAWVFVEPDRLRLTLGSEHGAPSLVLAQAPLLDSNGHALRPVVGVVHVATSVAERAPVERPPFPDGVRNVLTDDERAAGWRLLFDGKSLAGWKNWNATGPVAGWAVEDGALTRVADGGGDLVTEELFESFELEFEWRLRAGGNSGVFFHVVDGFDYVWRTGPEYQLLDNSQHADGKNPLTSAGANYALHAPEYDDTRPIGSWNHSRLVVDGVHVEHWLNGEKQCEYELWSDDWHARVAGSKFAAMPDYGLAKTGRIALQDHGDFVAFKNLKLRSLVR